jgi:ABC-type dipeptide/oligopeptide/nickel transport system permease component
VQDTLNKARKRDREASAEALKKIYQAETQKEAEEAFIDYGCMTVAVIGVSMPNIVIGPLLIWIFALNLKWLPVARWGTPAHVVLPALTLSAPYTARFARFTRAAILEVLNEEYVRTARAKGLSERLTIIHHVLRNALIPVITVAGPAFAGIITGSMVVEQIFAIPGIGKYYVTSVNNRDYPVIMTFTLIFAFCIIMMNLLVDILFAIIDPRIRYT